MRNDWGIPGNVNYPWMSEAHEMPASTRLNFEGSGEQVLGFDCALLLYILLSHIYCACSWCIYSHSRAAPTYFGISSILCPLPTADIYIYMCVLLIHMLLSSLYVVIVRASRELYIYMCALLLVESCF